MHKSQAAYTEIFVWGNDSQGQLGLGQSSVPVVSVPKLISFGIVVVKVSCGDLFSAIIDDQARMYTMGSNSGGRLGVPGLASSQSPVLVESLANFAVNDISCGGGFGLALIEEGAVYTWGDSNTGKPLYIPTKVKAPRAKKISAGHQHAICIDVEGKGWAWGCGDYGMLGTGKTKSSPYPTPLKLGKLAQIACGYNISVFLTSQGDVITAGSDLARQIAPRTLTELKALNIVSVAAGHHFAAISPRGELYIWGRGAFGEFFVPQKVNVPFEVASVDIGACATVVVGSS
jgi:alpha-tubulin suppressor-like RCC1 family protein